MRTKRAKAILAIRGILAILVVALSVQELAAEVLPVNGPCRIKLRSGRFIEARGLAPVDATAAFWRIQLDGESSLVVPARELKRVEVLAFEPEQVGIVPLAREGVLVPDGELARGCDPASDPRVTRWEPLLRDASARHGLDVDLVRAVVAVESCGDPDAISHKGAVGLMQLMPGTARDYGCTNPRDPSANVNAGCAHLARLQQRLVDPSLVLAAYNAGERAVERSKGIPNFRETQAYVRNVLAQHRRLRENPTAM